MCKMQITFYSFLIHSALRYRYVQVHVQVEVQAHAYIYRNRGSGRGTGARKRYRCRTDSTSDKLVKNILYPILVVTYFTNPVYNV